MNYGANIHTIPYNKQESSLEEEVSYVGSSVFTAHSKLYLVYDFVSLWSTKSEKLRKKGQENEKFNKSALTV